MIYYNYLDTKLTSVVTLKRSRKERGVMSIADILSRQSEYSRQVAFVRTLDPDSIEYRETKRKTVPMWYPIGIVEDVDGHLLVKSFSGFMCIDVDGKDNPGKTVDEIRRIVEGWSYTCYCSLSIGGRGVFALVKVPEDTIQGEDFTRFRAISRAFTGFAESFGIVVDACSERPCQGRFFSIDDNPYYNPDSDVYSHAEPLPHDPQDKPQRAQVQSCDDTGTYERVERLLDLSSVTGIDIAQSYKEWYNCGLVFYDSFGYDRGLHLFLRMSDIWVHNTGRRHDDNPIIQYTKCVKVACSPSRQHPMTIGYVFNLARDYGLTLKE